MTGASAPILVYVVEGGEFEDHDVIGAFVDRSAAVLCAAEYTLKHGKTNPRTREPRIVADGAVVTIWDAREGAHVGTIDVNDALAEAQA